MRLTYSQPVDFATKPAWRWPNFQPSEFRSANDPAGRVEIETDFMDRLQRLRTMFGRPMIINSGYRSPAYNDKVSTTGLHGPHTTGRAVDVKVLDSSTRFLLVTLAIECGFTGIGIAKTFVHLDDIINNPKIPRPMLWLY